jgi:hypothetical protein
MIGLVISNDNNEKNIKNLLKFFAKTISIELYSKDKQVIWSKRYTDYNDIVLTMDIENAKKMLYMGYKQQQYNKNKYLKCIFPDPVVDELCIYNVLPESECIMPEYIHRRIAYTIEYYEEIAPFNLKQQNLKYYIPLDSINLVHEINKKLINIMYKNIKMSLSISSKNNNMLLLLYKHICESNEDIYVLEDNRLISNQKYYQDLLENNNQFLEYVNLLYKDKRISNINIIKIND